MIVTKTPLRIPLGGGGTDLPFYCSKYGCSLITAAINKYMYITINERLEKGYKLNYSKTELIENLEDIDHPLIKEALKFVDEKRALEIHSVGEMPPSSGLGSSSTFLIGLLNALYYNKGEIASKYKLAEDSSTIMMDILKEPCGKQDQYAAAFGNVLHLKVNQNGKALVSPVNLKHETLKKLERNLMMFYTGIQRSAIDILEDQKKNSEKEETKSFEYYHEIKKIGEESLKCLEKDNLRRYGEWMNIHWELKRRISNKISSPQIEEWYQTALANGAIGGKLMGAGGGGFFLFYVEEQNQEKLKRALNEKGLVYTDFKFDFEGSKVVYDGKHF